MRIGIEGIYFKLAHLHHKLSLDFPSLILYHYTHVKVVEFRSSHASRALGPNVHTP